MGVKCMRDVVAHHVCSSIDGMHVESLSDVEMVMRGLGYGKTEKFETSEGQWLRFLCSSLPTPSAPPDGRPPQTPSEYAYLLKLPIHLHVQPEPEVHFRPFVQAVLFFTGKDVFHLKKVDCEDKFCNYLTSCKELYGYQRAPRGLQQY
ncbi:hypothetical protein KP509_21G065500 [Ceratopteris richardii]|uniref:Uncharacterized protein n=1 Tax=Ceratopteris richardii TaxID=49495 RepID=A0A8T2SAR6_CERRI|nr:hypothetical protein KP509_21G065500 [Ceratopteris richardii]KAH7315790.1 hypothetical protein KP509_21G065500 [Ceratopteris richardii]